MLGEEIGGFFIKFFKGELVSMEDIIFMGERMEEKCYCSLQLQVFLGLRGQIEN